MLGFAPLLTLDGALATITLRRLHQANRLEPADLQTLRSQLDQMNQTEAGRALLGLKQHLNAIAQGALDEAAWQAKRAPQFTGS